MKNKYLMTEKPNRDLTKHEQENFDAIVVDAIYQSLFAAGKINEEQLKYLNNINHKFW